MKQCIKDNFGLLTMSIETTIRDLENFFESAKDTGLKDSPKETIRNTIEEYKSLMDKLINDDISDYNEKQLKMIMEHRLRVLNTQKEKVDLTIPLVTKFIEELDKSIT